MQSHLIVDDFIDMDSRDIKETVGVVVASAFFDLFPRPKAVGPCVNIDPCLAAQS